MPVIWIVAAVVGAAIFTYWRRNGLTWWKELGFSRIAAVPDFAAGTAISALAMAGVFGVHLLLRQIELTSEAPRTVETLQALPILLIFALVEEVLYRGFLLNGLIIVLKRAWLAVLISSVVFGLAHAANPGATALSVISTMIGGVMYSLAYLGTGRIWLAWGVHFAWNFFQGSVFGFIVSGMEFGGLIRHTTIGDPLLTGGSYGPEGGLIGIGFRFVVILLIVLWCSQRRQDTSVSGIGDDTSDR